MTFGRIYNNDILDMFELVLTNSQEILDSSNELTQKIKSIDFAFKTTFIALGDVFEENKQMEKVRNFFNDFFHANEENVTVSLKSVFKVVAVLIGLPDNKLILRFYTQNGTELDSLTPAIHFKLNRTSIANDGVYKKALIKPTLQKTSRKMKNLEGNLALGEVYGRVHVRQQNLKSLKLRFSKKIKKTNDKTKS